MHPKRRSFSKRKLLLFIMTVFSISAVLFYILYCTRSIFTSDMAYWLLMADEQIKTRQFFPDGFCYTTGILIFSPELIVLVLRLFCQDWLLCRELTVILLVLAAIVLIFYFYHHTLSGKNRYTAALLSILMLTLPMMHYWETFYEAAYTYQIIWDLLLMLLIYRLLFSQAAQEERRNYLPLLYIVWFILIFLCSIKGMKSIFLFTLPIVVSFPVFSYIENQFRIELVLKNKKQNILLVLTIIGTVLGVTGYTALSKILTLESISGSVSFVSMEKLTENFNKLIPSILRFYYATGEKELVSLSGITSGMYLIVMFLCAIVSPVWMILRYKKVKKPFWRFYTIYAFISNFLLLYTMLFTNASNIIYYELVFWHNIVFTSILLTDLIKAKGKYFEGFIYAVTTIIVLCGHLNYMTETVLPIRNEYKVDQEEGTLIDFLKENDLNYGFSTFWNSYKYMALSNGEIKLVSYIITPSYPYYWMTSRSYYDVGKHPGRCFILVAPDDEAIDDKYYLATSEIKEYKDYKILIYEKNILLYDELNTQ